MDKEINLNQICRICLLKAEDLCDMGSTKLESICLLEALNYTFGQKCLQDKFPKCICKQCAIDVEFIYNFRLKFEKSFECISTLLLPDSSPSREQPVSLDEVEEITTYELKSIENTDEVCSETALPGNSNLDEIGKSPKNSQLNDLLDIKCEIKEEPIDDGTVEWSSFVDENYFELSNLDEASADLFDDQTIESDQKFLCSHCGSNFNSNESLITHMQTHEGTTDMSFKYSTCGQNFDSDTEFQTHMATHKGKKLYECTICHKVFQRKWNLQKHQAVHSNERPHKCGICGIGFTTGCIHQEHEAKHSNSALHVCDICNKTFVHKWGLALHLQSHNNNERPHKCNICGKGFSQKWVLRNHEAIHNGSNPYVCKVCDKGFVTKQGLKRHEVTHASVKPFKCETCGSTFTQKSSMRTHIDSIHFGIRYECDICSMTFSTKRSLKTHQINHNLGPKCLQDKFPKLICKQCAIDVEFTYSFRQKCEKSFECTSNFLLPEFITSKDQSRSYDEGDDTNEFEIKPHWGLNDNKFTIELYSETSFECNTDQNEKPQSLAISEFEDFREVKCEIKEEPAEDNMDGWSSYEEKNYFELSNLDAASINFFHLNEGTNESDDQTTCNNCGQYFDSNESLIEHMQTHAGAITNGAFKCEPCGEIFSSESEFQIHEAIHVGKKPYECTICNKTFLRKWNFKQHALVHSSDRPYKCNICGKSFSTRCVLRDHEATHSGTRPHICDVCNKGFITKQVLKRHQVTHTNEKRFNCSTCGKTFTQKTSLQSHQAIHSGIKPHVCEICNKTFVRKWNLRQHQITHMSGWDCEKTEVVTT